MKKIAVIGAGILGITIALKLKKYFEVDLYESKKDILQAASMINQGRLHKGYHYPRSNETVFGAIKGTEKFLKMYPCKMNSNQYYGISNNGSKIAAYEYESFLSGHKLPFKKCNLDIIKEDYDDLGQLKLKSRR